MRKNEMTQKFTNAQKYYNLIDRLKKQYFTLLSKYEKQNEELKLLRTQVKNARRIIKRYQKYGR